MGSTAPSNYLTKVNDFQNPTVYFWFKSNNMKNQGSKVSMKKLARITGVFYLLIIICGLYSGIAVRAPLIDLTDGPETVNNILSNEGLYRLGFFTDTVMVISDVMVSVLFFILLSRVSWIMALLAAAFRLIQASVLGANLINLFSPLLLVGGYGQATGSQQEFIVSSVIHHLEVFEFGYLISGVFFAINCFLMGYLLYRSGYFPRFWGAAIFLAGVAYFLNCIANFSASALAEYTQLMVMIFAIFGELGLCLFLLIKGISPKREASP